MGFERLVLCPEFDDQFLQDVQAILAIICLQQGFCAVLRPLFCVHNNNGVVFHTCLQGRQRFRKFVAQVFLTFGKSASSVLASRFDCQEPFLHCSAGIRKILLDFLDRSHQFSQFFLGSPKCTLVAEEAAVVVVDRASYFSAFVDQGGYSLPDLSQLLGKRVHVRAELLAAICYPGLEFAHLGCARRKLCVDK